ncbi:MAG: hypothetical protein WBQ95_15105 [Terracidiphilus sp.]
MTLEGRLDIYRVAFESAKSELTEILEEFEKLRIRKEHIEKLVTVLRPLLGEGEPTPDPVSAGDSTQGQAESAGEVPVEQRSAPDGLVADPFQRRIDHVLGIGAGIRDVRKYSRQF